MNAVAGISGGRTSARMAYLLDPSVVLSFQNTGREHPKTLEFVDQLEQDLGRPIFRLEFRAPTRGDEPRKATFEVVEHRYLARRGEPFKDLLDCLKTYRAKHKDAGPVAPWARSRICTAYLKIRTQRKFCASLGWGHQRDYTEYVGLRVDEPERVARMKERNDRLDTDERAPLHELGIDKAAVLRFWREKHFDLYLPEHLGNCTGCFLKDERDLASALLDEETDAAWWIDIEERYAPMRRGRSSYRQVLEEAPARMEIRQALTEGRPYHVDLPTKRVKLIVAQELAERTSFSCECDAAKADDFDDAIEGEVVSLASFTPITQRKSMSEIIAKPILKWAGAKNWFVPTALPVFRQFLDSQVGPARGRFFDPFLGGGAIPFALGHYSVVADILEPLVEFYEVVRDAPGELAWATSALAMPSKKDGTGIDKESFLRVRDMRPDNKLGRAARFFYLMRLGFNGLYRENAKGEFNVPYGDAVYRPSIVGRSSRDALEALFPNREKIQKVSDVLKRFVFGAADFEEVIGDASAGDLVYADPPYLETYNGYSKSGFALADQERLAYALYQAHERGATIVAHNALVPLPEGVTDTGIEYWYSEWCGIIETNEKRSIAANGSKRVRTPCVLISNHAEILASLERGLSASPAAARRQARAS